MRRLLALSAAALAIFMQACSANPAFRDAPPVWEVNDRRDIPEPEEREYDPKVYFAKIFFIEALTRALELRDQEPAWNTNSLDEVPNSSWFTNRIGVRAITPAEAARGSSTGGPPRPPYRVIRSKAGGGNPGFVMADATDRKFLVKFDTVANPELQTAAGVLVNRIFWTLGYNVPSDHVFTFRREELTIDPAAYVVDELKQKHPLDAAALGAILATSPRKPDGSYRAFSSEYLGGKPKGGFAPSGKRADDPNDTVPHEHRRELRGLRVFASWVGHTDMKEDNTLDLYVTEDGRRFLRHYLLDFGESLDGHAAEKGRPEDGFEYLIDWENQLKATLAFGLWKRPWEDVKSTRWPSVGTFSARGFDPKSWREAYPYWPFAEMDPRDAYWAAKLVLRFDEPLLRAIVAQGQYSDPDAAEYVLETLLARRDAIGRAYLDAVSPLDDFTIHPAPALCMTDMGMRLGLVRAGIVERLEDGRVVEFHTMDERGRVCMPIPTTERYTRYTLRVRRGRETRPPLEVHFKGGRGGRILGVERLAP